MQDTLIAADKDLLVLPKGKQDMSSKKLRSTDLEETTEPQETFCKRFLPQVDSDLTPPRCAKKSSIGVISDIKWNSSLL